MKYRDYNPDQSCLPAEAYLRLTGAVKPSKSPIMPIIKVIQRMLRALLAIAFLVGCKAKPPDPPAVDMSLIYFPKKEATKPRTFSI